MVGYALERIGWFHFEQLCAALLELEGDVAPLAWAGGSDHCRAVLSGTALAPPLLTRQAPEPVLLVCSWVRSGRPGGLLASVDRLLAERSADIAVAKSLVILTNVERTAKLETRVRGALADPRVKVRILGRAEIGRRLDARAELRRAMPSVLGLRDLDRLIDAEVAARSSLDLPAASALAAVFMPTRAYRRALGVLDRHRFAVLSGPPEMGKTAIARTIALAQLTNGWEAHECIRPEEIWRVFDPDRPQVFVADDAFGSTEYRADAGERWASEMERILGTLDDRHWLIWTSRPAPLKAGLRRIRLERGAERFPSPGEVLVDASALDVAEKTLILFRHAKAAQLSQELRLWLERAGAEIVDEPHFTPERIRRFIARLKNLTEPEMEIPGLMRRELADPTEAMATSFQTLEAEHKDLLIAMLDTPPGPVPERELVEALRRHHDGALHKPPVELLDRLSDHFLRTARMGIEWVHPSWRDLVIEHLAEDRTARLRFLSHCGIHGAALALSVAGGRDGQRRLPLLVNDADWDALSDRLYVLLPGLDGPDLSALLSGIHEAILRSERDPTEVELLALARSVLQRLVSIWNGTRAPVPLPALDGWFALAGSLPPEPTPPSPPDLTRTWAELFPAVTPDLADRASTERFADWLALADLLRQYRPAELDRLHFDNASETIGDFLTDVERDPETIHPAAYEHVMSALRRIQTLTPAVELRSMNLASRLGHATQEPAATRHPPEPPPRRERTGRRRFDVGRVLQDL
jgi:hypothetical protein